MIEICTKNGSFGGILENAYGTPACKWVKVNSDHEGTENWLSSKPAIVSGHK